MAVKIFFSYAHEDKKLRDKLAEHLSLLNWEGLTTSWYDGDIRGGMEWEDEINQQLKTADIILLLISRAFMASKFCYSNEMEKAMARHEAKEACVIPIILRPVLWKGAKFSKLQALPSNGKAVTSWANQDEAFLEIAEGIQGVVEKLSKNIEIISQINGRQAPSPPFR